MVLTLILRNILELTLYFPPSPSPHPAKERRKIPPKYSVLFSFNSYKKIAFLIFFTQEEFDMLENPLKRLLLQINKRFMMHVILLIILLG